MSSSSLKNMFAISPKHLLGHLTTLFGARLVPFVRSSPGMGKSAIYAQCAEQFDLEMIDIRLSMYSPEDFSGLPFRNAERQRTEFMPMDLIPLEGDEIPEGKQGFLVLLDEFNHAEPEMVRASYKLILDRMVGQRKIHPNVFIALAGNNIDDNALANPTGTALNSRVTHLKLVSDPDWWVNDVAARFGYDHRVIGFIAANKDKLNDFDPDQDEHGFCCERTWEMVSKIILNSSDVDPYTPLIAGTITPGVAAEFIQFCKIYQELITVNDVVADPANCRMPTDSPTRWATVTYLAKQVNKNNASEICEYINRYQLQYSIIFASMVKDIKDVSSNPEFIKIVTRIGKAA